MKSTPFPRRSAVSFIADMTMSNRPERRARMMPAKSVSSMNRNFPPRLAPRALATSTSSPWAHRRRGLGLLDELDDVEHRHVEGNDHAADHGAEEHDQDRLEQGGEGVDGRFDLLAVELADLVEHGVHRSGLFPDGDHLGDHRWK